MYRRHEDAGERQYDGVVLPYFFSGVILFTKEEIIMARLKEFAKYVRTQNKIGNKWDINVMPIGIDISP
jgi:hypothetical protein